MAVVAKESSLFLLSLSCFTDCQVALLGGFPVRDESEILSLELPVPEHNTARSFTGQAQRRLGRSP